MSAEKRNKLVACPVCLKAGRKLTVRGTRLYGCLSCKVYSHSRKGWNEMVRSIEGIDSEAERKLAILEELFSRRRQFKGWGAVISLYEEQVDDSHFAICGEMMTAFGDHFTLDAGKHQVFVARELIRSNPDSVLPPLDKFRLYSKRMSSSGILRAIFLEIAKYADDHVKRMPDSGGVCVPSFFMRIAEEGGEG